MEGGGGWHMQGYGRTLGVASLRPPSAWRLHVGPSLLPRGLEAQYVPVGGLFLVCLLRICFVPSLVVHFDNIFNVFRIYVLQKH